MTLTTPSRKPNVPTGASCSKSAASGAVGVTPWTSFSTSIRTLTALRDKNFITVKINFSEENPNKEVLSRYGEINGYPHIFVLGSDGKLLHSQDTAVFEEGRGYVLERLTTFLTHWAPAPK